MIIKKKLVNATLATMIMGSFSSIASAEENTNNASTQTVVGSKVVYQGKEIKNIDLLLERAKKGVTDVDESTTSLDAQVTKNTSKGGEKEKIKSYRTTQKLNETRMPSGETVETYSTTVIVPLADASQYRSNNDASYGVVAYSRIYWSYVYSGSGIKYMKHEGIDGGWQINDSQLRVSNQYLRIGVSGKGMDGLAIQKYAEYSPSSTFSYSAPASWGAVRRDTTHILGAYMKCTVSDNSDSWVLELFNNDKL